MADVIENPTLAQIENPALAGIDNPLLTGQPQVVPPMPGLAAVGAASGEPAAPAGLREQSKAVEENPPLLPMTGTLVQGESAAPVPDFGTGRRLVPGVIPQIENPDLD